MSFRCAIGIHAWREDMFEKAVAGPEWSKKPWYLYRRSNPDRPFAIYDGLSHQSCIRCGKLRLEAKHTPLDPETADELEQGHLRRKRRDAERKARGE